jgi:hypothetical protein
MVRVRPPAHPTAKEEPWTVLIDTVVCGIGGSHETIGKPGSLAIGEAIR